MDDISIKILDALFDLCDGENFVILEKDDLTSRISYYDFAVDELTETLEALSADGLIDLKYADNQEFCVSMKTKGRSLIKQSRERLQKLIDENPELAEAHDEQPVRDSKAEPLSPEEERERIYRAQEDKLAEARLGVDEAISPDEKAASREELRRVKKEIRQERARVTARTDSGRPSLSYNNLTRGYNVQSTAESESRNESRDRRKDKKMILAAFFGALVGSAIVNVIFLIIFMIKFAK